MNEIDQGETNSLGDDAVPPSEIGGSSVGGDVSMGAHSTFAGRDHITINNPEVGVVAEQLLEVLLKHVQMAYITHPEKLDLMFTKFQRLYAELKEHKLLHKLLDDTIQYYGPFQQELENASQTTPNPTKLQNSWSGIAITLDELLKFAASIQYIGQKYSINQDGEISGESWAIKLELARREIETNLSDIQKTVEPVGPLAFMKKLFGLSDPDDYRLILLRDNANHYRSMVLAYMHMADANLSTTVAELIELSGKLLGGQGE